MTEYTILIDDSSFSMIERVTSLMSNGWKPQGGIIHCNGYFYQAMVKDK